MNRNSGDINDLGDALLKKKEVNDLIIRRSLWGVTGYLGLFGELDHCDRI